MKNEDMLKPFPITSLSREDIRCEMPDVDVEQLDDAAMESIAAEMSDAYMTGGAGFWGDMRIIVEYIINR